jgi:hypothetical protein
VYIYIYIYTHTHKTRFIGVLSKLVLSFILLWSLKIIRPVQKFSMRTRRSSFLSSNLKTKTKLVFWFIGSQTGKFSLLRGGSDSLFYAGFQLTEQESPTSATVKCFAQFVNLNVGVFQTILTGVTTMLTKCLSSYRKAC